MLNRNAVQGKTNETKPEEHQWSEITWSKMEVFMDCVVFMRAVRGGVAF